MPPWELPQWGEVDEQAFRPQWQFKFQAHFNKWFGLPQCLKTYHLSLYNIKKDMLLTGPFAMLSMPSFDFHLPPCTEGFLIHLSPLWQLPLWQLPLFPSVAQFPCVGLHRILVYLECTENIPANTLLKLNTLTWPCNKRLLDEKWQIIGQNLT